MTKQNQTANTATVTKTQQPKPTPATAQEVVVAPELTGVTGFTGTTAFQQDANRLGNPHLQRIQRQMMASRIGQTHGNGHLQQVVAFVKQGRQVAPYQPNKLVSDAVTSGKRWVATSARHLDRVSTNESDFNEATSTEEVADLWGESDPITSPTATELLSDQVTNPPLENGIAQSRQIEPKGKGSDSTQLVQKQGVEEEELEGVVEPSLQTGLMQQQSETSDESAVHGEAIGASSESVTLNSAPTNDETATEDRSSEEGSEEQEPPSDQVSTANEEIAAEEESTTEIESVALGEFRSVEGEGTQQPGDDDRGLDATSEGASVMGPPSGDAALIDFELAEHERWSGSFGEMGTAGSDQRAQFLLDQAGQGAVSGAAGGAGMGFVMGAIGSGVGQIAGRRLATLAVSRGLAATPIPGLGSAIGGVMAVAGLAMRDWGAFSETTGRIGTGEGYEGLANDLEGIAEILDVATQVMDVLAGVLGGIAVGMWVGAVLSGGVLSPLAASLSAVALGINLATTAIGVIISMVVRPTVTALRALHTFESQGDPAQIEAEGQQLQAAASQITGAVAGAAAGRAGGAAGRRGGARVDSAVASLQARQTSGRSVTSAAAGSGPRLNVEAPETPHPITPDVVIQGDYSDASLAVLSGNRRKSGQASVGDIGAHGKQGNRGSDMISEHVIPGAQMRDASQDPRYGAPDWQRSTEGGSDGTDYRNATTITEHKAVSDRKTALDNAATRALQERGGPVNLTDDLLLPSLERHQRAVDDAIAAGEITPDQATDPTHRALAALAELWGGGDSGGGAKARSDADAEGTRLSTPRRADRRREVEGERRQARLAEEDVLDFDDYDWDATFTSDTSVHPTDQQRFDTILGGTRTAPIGLPGMREGSEFGRQMTGGEEQAEDAADRPERGPAYTASATGLQPGESVEIPINPVYPEPPGTTAELDVLRERISVTQAAQSELAATEGTMAAQADQQQTHSSQLEEAQTQVQDLASGRADHQAAVDSTESTNTEQQSTAGDAISNLGRSAEEAAALGTLVGSLGVFQGLAHLFTYLPGNLGQQAEGARDDASELITTLNRVNETENVQANVETGRSAIVADAQRIETVANEGQQTDVELTSGQEQVSELEQANAASLAETESVQQEATQERQEAAASEDEAQTAHDDLLARLQEWAQAHREAREVAIQDAMAQYSGLGYQVSEA